MLRFVLLAALASAAFAGCSNQCSGHGTCGSEDQCSCFPRWSGPDCSKRQCQFRPSWVAQTDEEAAQAIGPATGVLGGKHGYTECSSKGKCDAESGECECFEGYTGVACSRQVCPLHCSGHGRCVTNRHASDDYTYDNHHVSQFWDRDMTRQCECDRGWTGFACDARICPVGADPLTCDQDIHDPSRQRITISNLHLNAGTYNDGTDDRYMTFISLKFKDMYGGVYTTQPIRIRDMRRSSGWDSLNQYTDTNGDPFVYGSGQILENYDANRIRQQLQSLPNFAIPNINVTDHFVGDASTHADQTAAAYDGDRMWDVVFTDAANAGIQELMECIIASPYTDEPAVSPRMEKDANQESLDPTSLYTSGPSCTVTHANTGIDLAPVHTCSNRGICATDTGICQCFDGYAGEDCSLQNIYF